MNEYEVLVVFKVQAPADDLAREGLESNLLEIFDAKEFEIVETDWETS